MRPLLLEGDAVEMERKCPAESPLPGSLRDIRGLL